MRRHAIFVSLFGISQATPFLVYNTMKGGDLAPRRARQKRIIAEDTQEKIVEVSFREIGTKHVETRDQETNRSSGDSNWMNTASSKTYGHYIW